MLIVCDKNVMKWGVVVQHNTSMMGCGWFLDSGASFHMTYNKIFFSTFEENDLKMCIEMGDDERYSVSRVGAWSSY